MCYGNRRFNVLKRNALMGIIAILILFVNTVPVRGDTPYQGYTYNFWGHTVPAPVSYVAIGSVRASDIDASLGAFSNPRDIAVSSNGNIYLADTGNNRIVVFNYELELLQVIDGFYNNGQHDSFDRPHGVFVCRNYNIYVADTENRRIVILDAYGQFQSQISNLDMGDIYDEVDFRPLRVAADYAGRVYVIVMHVFEGIMRFDTNGEFFGYFGTIDVRVSPLEILWRTISTQEQRSRMRRFVPTEFTGMDIDDYGFVFATHTDTTGEDQVMRLNPRGNNVLRNLNENVSINGDQVVRLFGPLSGNSAFIDIVARPNGMYSTLDATRGRVYTYCSEGNLLYVFSGVGDIMGMNHMPVAIGALDDLILVVDAERDSVVFFEPTEYGRLINEAIMLRYRGDDVGALAIWEQLLTMDENLTLAFTGIGRALLLEGDYITAMDYLRRGMDWRHYSLALQGRRQAFLEDNLSTMLTVGVAIAFIFVIRAIYKQLRRGEPLHE